MPRQYLPDAIKDMTFYEPNDIGHEKDIKEYFRNIGKDPQRYKYKDPSQEGNPDRPWE